MIFTNQALALFPPALGQAIANTQRDRQELVEEICCRIGQVPVLLTQAHVYPAECRAILAGDLDYLSSARRERPFTRPENRSGRGTYRRPAAAASGFAAALTDRLPGRSTASGS